LTDKNLDDVEQNIFEERAERLSRTELKKWTELSEIDTTVIDKLKGPGVKLLMGPRGSGKSTLLKFAYYESLDSTTVLPAYVNYSQSLALEPLFHSQANALKLFRQWVLLKIIIGIHESVNEINHQIDQEINSRASIAKSIIRDLEKGNTPEILELETSPSELIEFLESVLQKVSRNRCVLLLDDAAHAFSIEQQREFFEIFRQLRSRKVACKAAIYPGITSFSHSFNVGHEAEVIEAWYDPAEDYYLPLMRQIAHKRLGTDIITKLGSGFDEYVSLLALAASGQPRGFINMLSEVVGDENNPKTLTRRKTLNAIDSCASYVDGVFRALSDRLPRYKDFVTTGESIKNIILNSCNEFNKLKIPEKKIQAFGVKEPLNIKLEKIFQFYEYAGIVRKLKTHSRGKTGSYQRYQLHSAIMTSGSGIGLGKTFSTSDLIKSLSNYDAHDYCKISPSKLLKDQVESLALNLPACVSCGSDRVAADQKFCMKCGSKLTEASLYKELLQKPISALSIPRKKIEGISKHTKLKTIEDIVLDEDQTLRSVPGVGKVWSARIRNLAEEYVSV